MYIVNDKVYEKVSSDLFTVFKEVEVPTIKDITPEFHGKPIPMSMWHDIMHCMKQTQDKFKSEALVLVLRHHSQTTLVVVAATAADSGHDSKVITT